MSDKMKLVKPTDETSLLLTIGHTAFSFCTARAAFRHLITGRVKGMDANDNIVSWDGSELDRYPSVENTMNWAAGNMALYDDQPYLRSAPNPETGEETKHFIPTRLICTRHFGIKARRGDNVSLKHVYKVYKGICQYCYVHIPYTEATKDHVYPRSKGGSNDDFNIVLACRRCNSEKSDQFPFYDKDGKLPMPRKRMPSGIFIPDVERVRPEWRPYFFMDPIPVIEPAKEEVTVE